MRPHGSTLAVGLPPFAERFWANPCATFLPVWVTALALVLTSCSVLGNEPELVVPVAVNDTVPEACTGVSEPDVVGYSGRDGTYCLRPAVFNGTGIESASAFESSSNWKVSLTFAKGAKGIDRFNQAAAECSQQSPLCPLGRLALSLDNRVMYAPQVLASEFEHDQIEIDSQFTEQEAKELAAVLNDERGGIRIGFSYVVQTSAP